VAREAVIHAARVVAALAMLAAIAGCKRQNAYVAPPPPPVQVAHPLQQPVTPYLEVTGNTVAYNEVDLVARVSGFLQEIRYKDGAFAHRGDTLFVIEPAPYQAKLQQAEAALAGAQANFVQSDAEFKRQAEMARGQLAASQSAVDQARATRDNNSATVLSDQAGVTLAATNVAYTQVNAPFDGIVTAHLESVGELVGQNAPTKLATIVQLDPIYATFNISEQDVLRIRAGLRERGLTAADLGKVPVEVGLMTEQGYPHTGTLDYASPVLDSQTGTLTVRGVFANADRALLPGFFVRVRVPMTLSAGPALLVPETALGADQSGRYLLVVDKDDVVQQRTVTTGQLVGALRVISSGLQADDKVVVSGLERAIPGGKVAPQETKISATP
jgi:RND family efflux transporter MFP subunit